MKIWVKKDCISLVSYALLTHAVWHQTMLSCYCICCGHCKIGDFTVRIINYFMLFYQSHKDGHSRMPVSRLRNHVQNNMK